MDKFKLLNAAYTLGIVDDVKDNKYHLVNQDIWLDYQTDWIFINSIFDGLNCFSPIERDVIIKLILSQDVSNQEFAIKNLCVYDLRDTALFWALLVSSKVDPNNRYKDSFEYIMFHITGISTNEEQRLIVSYQDLIFEQHDRSYY